MSDETENQSEEAAEAGSKGPVAGERLAEARREQQISVLEIAKELHLDEPKVRALERNEFDVIGAPVFAKGHLKKYAQLVGVDVADVLKDYYELSRATTMPPVIPSRKPPRRELSPGPWIAVIVAVIVAATAYWWLTSRPAAVEQPEPELSPEETAPQEADPVQADDTMALAANTTPEPEVTTPEVSEPEVFEADVTEAEVTEAVLDDSELRLLVTYTGDCWTEITDASGRRLFFDLGKEGRTVELRGEAPFNVLFGNADNVSLQVNGAEYAIGANDRRGRTARMTIPGT